MTSASVARNRAKPTITLGRYGNIDVVGSFMPPGHGERCYHVVRMCCGTGQALWHTQLQRMIGKASDSSKCCFCSKHDPRMNAYAKNIATKISIDRLFRGEA